MSIEFQIQLRKCKNVIISEDLLAQSVFIIDSQIAQQKQSHIDFQLNKYYIIKLARYILYPPENFDLNTNWNKGINPQSEYMLATPVKFLGKMTQFDCCGYDYDNQTSKDDVYSGLWLPSKGFEIISEIEN